PVSHRRRRELTVSETEGFYYNLSTGAVEEGRQSPGSELMGPYQTRAEAERALQIAATRNEAWEEADEEWQDWGEPPAESEYSRLAARRTDPGRGHRVRALEGVLGPGGGTLGDFVAVGTR